jgi:hypothetical protein
LATALSPSSRCITPFRSPFDVDHFGSDEEFAAVALDGAHEVSGLDGLSELGVVGARQAELLAVVGVRALREKARGISRSAQLVPAGPEAISRGAGFRVALFRK